MFLLVSADQFMNVPLRSELNLRLLVSLLREPPQRASSGALRCHDKGTPVKR